MEPITAITLRGHFIQLPFADEKETMDVVNAQLLKVFGLPAAPEKTGIYLISTNAGFYSSVAFWKEVLDKGPGLANPERFPWTLANAPCGAMSRAFGITGPNYTFTGSSIDLPVVLEQIEFDVRQGIIDQAWLIAITFAEDQFQSTRMLALVFSEMTEIANVMEQISLYPNGVDRGSVDTLKEMVRFA
ncbi:MAG: hypothetical protein ACKVU0_12115 [Saprospiraceae bacterium]